MSQTSISVWFVCKLCRGSFRRVDEFIEHKKEEHFTEFQNTSCIVFEETESKELCPAIFKTETHLTDENIKPPIKVEVNDDDPIIPFSFSEMIDEPNLRLVQPKSELIIFETEITPKTENNFFELKQPEQNPYVLLKRLTAEEIQRACIHQDPSNILKSGQKNLGHSSGSPNLSEINNSMIGGNIEAEKSTEIHPTEASIHISAEPNLQLQCKLCFKQLESIDQLKMHVGICALHHEDLNQFCVPCNKLFLDEASLQTHCVKIHGNLKERLWPYNLRCRICSKQYERALDLNRHLVKFHKMKPEPKHVGRKTSGGQAPRMGLATRPN